MSELFSRNETVFVVLHAYQKNDAGKEKSLHLYFTSSRLVWPGKLSHKRGVPDDSGHPPTPRIGPSPSAGASCSTSPSLIGVKFSITGRAAGRRLQRNTCLNAGRTYAPQTDPPPKGCWFPAHRVAAQRRSVTAVYRAYKDQQVGCGLATV
jgi:hypothetical protein